MSCLDWYKSSTSVHVPHKRARSEAQALRICRARETNGTRHRDAARAHPAPACRRQWSRRERPASLARDRSGCGSSSLKLRPSCSSAGIPVYANHCGPEKVERIPQVRTAPDQVGQQLERERVACAKTLCVTTCGCLHREQLAGGFRHGHRYRSRAAGLARTAQARWGDRWSPANSLGLVRPGCIALFFRSPLPCVNQA